MLTALHQTEERDQNNIDIAIIYCLCLTAGYQQLW